eukprot:SAG31_NODE_39143_length_290_cov_1.282723_1_plen_53_part_01
MPSNSTAHDPRSTCDTPLLRGSLRFLVVYISDGSFRGKMQRAVVEECFARPPL